ncbi:ATP-dependent DNA helicase RecG [Campylobacter hominis]|uniref:ATP-dependent DNA helicase RecG n=2 Tax=Campylobacter hominis TaxID=76517 RepID=A7I245_CAMHC|nr:ATP-dependent DNA helicase RecG [Campylobacter hominis]ABS50996.1 ATP-dependent DNA helicase RecG [Campylobacter hominis ATCC BAA-381]SUW85110.1 ATP-dependent DNA helicase RecG [Campylobacter hominis]
MYNFDEKDCKKLAKMGVSSLLDLALILPKSFDDLSVKNEPNEGDNTVEIETKTLQSRNFILNITAFCYTWNCDIKITIFNARAWHFGAFKKGKKFFIHGKSNFNFGFWQFINPKIVTKIGEISPHYKLDLKDASVQEILKKYINYDALIQEGLNEVEANFIIQIHKNSQNSVKIIKNLDLNEKDRKILSFIEIFSYLKKLRAKKLDFPCKNFALTDISAWISKLPFKPTNDQQKAIDDIKNDLSSPIASKRVIMGDVGSGKTLVILAAALMNYPQISYLMAPTSILAEQIFNEAKRLLPDFMNTILVKSGEKTLNLNGANLVIGTHALLYHNLAKSNLVMVDEQHRFGSNQRDKIAELTKDGKYRANFLQFSATPIPRTLSMIQSEYVSFSFLKQMPFKKDIRTTIIQNNGFSELLRHIKSEISNGRQVIIVYPLVEESQTSIYQSLDEGTSFWQKRFKNVMITHGKDKDKDKKLEIFRDSGSLLLTTTVVEVGISLPRLSIIVIVGAEKMGLASLHQLRGRVGRNGGIGYCYLYTKLESIPERLKEFAATLDGFKVAEIDLKNRQAGDLLDGTIQHGETFNYFDYDEDIALKAKERLKKFKISQNDEMKF